MAETSVFCGCVTKDMRRWATEEIRLLGTIPDWRVAKQVGTSILFVRRKRKELGIDDWQPLGNRPFKIKPSASGQDIWTEEAFDLLGAIPDDNLALLMRIDPEEVRFQRIFSLIPMCHERV